LGIRTSKTVTIGTNPATATHTATYYVVDKNRDYAQVLAEWTAQWMGQTAPGPQTDALAVTYRYGHDLIQQTRDPLTTPVTHYFHYDGQLSTRHLTDSPADPLTNPPQVTDSYTYGAYGDLLDSSGSTANNYRYTGEQLDPDLGAANTPDTGNPAGLYYLRARYYNPGQGRFTGRDSFQGVQRDPITVHKYLYASGNPSNNCDPTGLMSYCQTVAVAALTIGLIGGLVNSSLRAVFRAISGRGWSWSDVGANFLSGFASAGITVLLIMCNVHPIWAYAVGGAVSSFISEWRAGRLHTADAWVRIGMGAVIGLAVGFLFGGGAASNLGSLSAMLSDESLNVFSKEVLAQLARKLISTGFSASSSSFVAWLLTFKDAVAAAVERMTDPVKKELERAYEEERQKSK
jgi:RHS repeat-associated protein